MLGSNCCMTLTYKDLRAAPGFETLLAFHTNQSYSMLGGLVMNPRQRGAQLLCGVVLAISIAVMIPAIRAHHFRVSCKTSHAGLAASQRFTCDISSRADYGFDAQCHTPAADIFALTLKEPAVQLLALAAPAPPQWRIRQLIKRSKLAPACTDGQDPLV
jgi:hypothetical protein